MFTMARHTVTVRHGQLATVLAVSVVMVCHSVNPFTVPSSRPVVGLEKLTESAVPSVKVKHLSFLLSIFSSVILQEL